jgi:hypothetical protein
MGVEMPTPLDEVRKRAVWEKGHVIEGYDPALWRRDDYSHAMHFPAYGDQTSVYGWEVERVLPTALGGGDCIGNLRPLHRLNTCDGGRLAGILSRIAGRR